MILKILHEQRLLFEIFSDALSEKKIVDMTLFLYYIFCIHLSKSLKTNTL